MAVGRINGSPHLRLFFLRKFMAVLPGRKKVTVRRGSMVVRGSDSGIGSHW